MNDKYYTPEIEEFHIGFECEIQMNSKTDDKTYWDGAVFGGINKTDKVLTSVITNHRALCKVKVKRLDREDIESLGFKFDISDTCRSGDWFILFNDAYPGKLEIRHRSPSWGFGGFHGKIKNKSELITILKQVGYEK